MKAKAKYVRIAPRKARLVADEVRGKSYEEAVSLLQFTNKRAARIIAEVVESAAANAEHNGDQLGRHRPRWYRCVAARQQPQRFRRGAAGPPTSRRREQKTHCERLSRLQV